MSPVKLPRLATTALAVAGAMVGLSALLFALANSHWVVVNVPAPLLDKSPFRPAFEAQVWAVMLTCLGLGLGSGLLLLGLSLRRNKLLAKRVDELEAELAELRRLLASVHGKR